MSLYLIRAVLCAGVLLGPRAAADAPDGFGEARYLGLGTLKAASLSPDGRQLATGGSHGIILWNLDTLEVIQRFALRGGEVRSLAFSPSAPCLAVLVGDAGPSRNETKVVLWHTTTGELIAEHAGVGYVLGFSPDGRYFASGGGQEHTTLLSKPFPCQRSEVLPEGTTEPSDGLQHDVSLFAKAEVWLTSNTGSLYLYRPHAPTSSDLTLRAAVQPDGDIELIETASGSVRFMLTGSGAPVTSLDFAPTDEWLASVSRDGTVRLWDLATGELQRALALEPPFRDGRVYFGPRGEVFAVVSGQGGVLLYDTESGRRITGRTEGRDLLWSLAFSQNGERLALLWAPWWTTAFVGQEDGMASAAHVEVIDTQTGGDVASLEGYAAWVAALAFSPTEPIVATASWRRVRLWNSVSGERLGQFEHSYQVFDVAFSPDGIRFVSAGNGGEVRLWDRPTGTLVASLRGHERAVYSVTYDPLGRFIASGGEGPGPTVRIWDARSGAAVTGLGDATRVVSELEFSPDGRFLAAASGTAVRVYEVGSWQLLHELEDAGYSLVFSPDSKLLASATGRPSFQELQSYVYSDALRVWSLESGARLHNLEHTSPVDAIAFHPSNGLIAGAAWDDSARFWTIASGDYQGVVDGYPLGLSALSFSPDGRLLVTGDYFGNVVLWDAETRGWLAQLGGHADRVLEVTFSPDGRWLASRSRDGTVQLWPVAR